MYIMFKLTITEACNIVAKIPESRRLEYHGFITKVKQSVRIIKTLNLESRHIYVNYDEMPKPEILC